MRKVCSIRWFGQLQPPNRQTHPVSPTPTQTYSPPLPLPKPRLTHRLFHPCTQTNSSSFPYIHLHHPQPETWASRTTQTSKSSLMSSAGHWTNQ